MPGLPTACFPGGTEGTPTLTKSQAGDPQARLAQVPEKRTPREFSAPRQDPASQAQVPPGQPPTHSPNSQCVFGGSERHRGPSERCLCSPTLGVKCQLPLAHTMLLARALLVPSGGLQSGLKDRWKCTGTLSVLWRNWTGLTPMAPSMRRPLQRSPFFPPL